MWLNVHWRNKWKIFKQNRKKNYISENTSVFFLYHAVSCRMAKSTKLSSTTLPGKGWIFWKIILSKGCFLRFLGEYSEIGEYLGYKHIWDNWWEYWGMVSCMLQEEHWDGFSLRKMYLRVNIVCPMLISLRER